MAVLFSISKATLGLFGIMCWVSTAESLKCHNCFLLSVEETKCPKDRTENCNGPGELCARQVSTFTRDPNADDEIRNSTTKRVRCFREDSINDFKHLRNRCVTDAELKTHNDNGPGFVPDLGEFKLTEFCGCDTNLCNFKEFGTEIQIRSSGSFHRTLFTSVISLLFLFAEYFSSMFV